MKICGISDIHGDLNINIPECDVLCICGDVINLNDQRDIPTSKKWWETRFVEWVKKLPCDNVIVVPGNHDFYIERMYNECWSWFCDHMKLLSSFKLTFLVNEEMDIDGLTFYGTPFIKPIDFQESRWAFESTDPKDYLAGNHTNIMITHDSPFENECLANMRNPISLPDMHCWFFGHWHEGEDEPGNNIYNCSRLDDLYNFKKNYEFVVVDVMTKIEALNEIKTVLENSELFKLPESNIIAEHNKKILDLLNKYIEEQEDGPVMEDTIPWDTSAEVLESSLITDFSD